MTNFEPSSEILVPSTAGQVMSMTPCKGQELVLSITSGALAAQTITLRRPGGGSTYDTLYLPTPTSIPTPPVSIPLGDRLFQDGLEIAFGAAQVEGICKLSKASSWGGRDVTFTPTYGDIGDELGLANHPATGVDDIDQAATNFADSDTERLRVYVGANAKATGNRLVVTLHPLIQDADFMFSDAAWGVKQYADRFGWVVLSPDMLSTTAFASELATQHVEGCIKWCLNNLGNDFIDEDSIVIGGFSLGGSVAGTMASQYQDPNGLMFAGLWMVVPLGDVWMRWNFLYAAGGNKQNPDHTANIEHATQANGSVTNPHTPYPPTFTAPEHRLNSMGFVKMEQNTEWARAQSNADPQVSMFSNPAIWNGILVPADFDRSQGVTLLNTPVYAAYDFFDIAVAGGGHQVWQLWQYFTVTRGDKPFWVQDYTVAENPTHVWKAINERLYDSIKRFPKVRRYPAKIEAVVNVDRTVGWCDIQKVSPGADNDFARIRVDPDEGGPSIAIANVSNVDTATLDVSNMGAVMARTDPSGVGEIAVTTDANYGAWTLVLDNLAGVPNGVSGTGFGAPTLGAGTNPGTGKATIPVTGLLDAVVT